MTIQEQINAAKTAELITVNQLALMAQYDPQTIYRKAKRGEIPGIVRYGRTIRFVRVVALAWGRRAQDERPISAKASRFIQP